MKAHECCPYNENKIIPGGYIFYDINFDTHGTLHVCPTMVKIQNIKTY
jgi:hypothetical protein